MLSNDLVIFFLSMERAFTQIYPNPEIGTGPNPCLSVNRSHPHETSPNVPLHPQVKESILILITNPSLAPYPEHCFSMNKSPFLWESNRCFALKMYFMKEVCCSYLWNFVVIIITLRLSPKTFLFLMFKNNNCLVRLWKILTKHQQK